LGDQEFDDILSAKLKRSSSNIPMKAMAISPCFVPSSQRCHRHVFLGSITNLFVVFFTSMLPTPVFTM